MRPIRSYVTRNGRITPAQQRAFDQHWTHYGIDFQGLPLDLDAVFGRRAARTLEIGFGNGDHLFELARAAPERDFLGVEVHRSGVGHLLLATASARLANIRVICHDALDVLQQIPLASLDEVLLLFPDPWPKKRHHKRRIVQPEFAAIVASRLRTRGRLHLATDWEPYALQMLAVLSGCAPLENCEHDGGFVTHSISRIPTRFEHRGVRLGHTVRDLLYRRRE